MAQSDCQVEAQQRDLTVPAPMHMLDTRAGEHAGHTGGLHWGQQVSSAGEVQGDMGCGSSAKRALGVPAQGAMGHRKRGWMRLAPGTLHAGQQEGTALHKTGRRG